MVEYLDLVDRNDRVISKETRSNIYSKDIHNFRVVGIFLLNDNMEILVPFRSDKCVIFPNCYDFSVAGHVKSGETYRQAAIREAKEELNIRLNSIEKFFYCKYPNDFGVNSFSTYYVSECPKVFKVNSREIKDYRFMKIEEIEKIMLKEPNKFKNDFKPVFEKFIEIYAII